MASDFANEMLKDKKIITGCANYYIFSSSSVPLLSQGQMAIPPLNAVMACYYYPYLPGNLSDYGQTFIQVKPMITENQEGIKMDYFLNTPPSETDASTMYFKQPIKITEPFLETVGNKILFEFDAYPTFSSVKSLIGHDRFDWRNEGKLYQYPYRYFEFNDGLMNPMYIEPQYLASNTSNKFRVKQYLNPYGSYECYIQGYKGDENGLIFPNEVTGLEVPVANDQYLNYLNENKYQRREAYISQAINLAAGIVNAGAGVVNAVHSGLKANLTPREIAAQGVQNATVGSLGIASALNSLAMTAAQEKDLKRLPNSLSLGGMYQFSLQKQQYMYKSVHRINDEDMERIALFFHMYGYQQNKLMIPNIHNRKYWNYIKCTQCNLKGNGIPKDQLVKLKQIFESGTTIWHIDNNATVGDYSKDNPEVY